MEKTQDPPKFLVDCMLGRLARWLRLLGFDAALVAPEERPRIILQSLKEGRIILSRDKRLSSKKSIRTLFISSGNFREQLKEVIQKIQAPWPGIYSRCSCCNTPLEFADLSLVKKLVPAHVFKTHREFSRCPSCEKIYWEGSHEKLFNRELEKMGMTDGPTKGD